MVDAVSPLDGRTDPGHFGASGLAGVTLDNRRLAGLWQLAGWDEFETAVQPVLAGLDVPGLGSYRQAQMTDSATVWRIAPDRALIETSQDLTSHGTESLMVLDLGHARTVITLSGPKARDVLAQVIAIDTSGKTFSPGEFVQTGIHHVGVLVHCTGSDAFDILVPGTWAETVWDVLFQNALPCGVNVGGEV